VSSSGKTNRKEDPKRSHEKRTQEIPLEMAQAMPATLDMVKMVDEVGEAVRMQ
jgi:hypothetical protein